MLEHMLTEHFLCTRDCSKSFACINSSFKTALQDKFYCLPHLQLILRQSMVKILAQSHIINK